MRADAMSVARFGGHSCVTGLAVDLTNGSFEIPHKGPEEIAAALENEHEAEGMKTTGEWPY